MISSDVIRGYTDLMILFMLLDGPSYGYALSRRLREVAEGKYAIKETTLYSAMTRLERNGHIRSFFGDESFGNRRTYYAITDSGRDYYREKCAEWELTKEVVNHFIQRG
jgi:PadR family transcriptional regulator PadR